jgi:very-short-patch-repair endonuclease
MSRIKGSIPWNKGIKGYKFSRDPRLHNLDLMTLSQAIKDGLSKSELENKFNVSEPTIYKYVNQLDLSFKKLLYENGRRKNKEGHQTLTYKNKISKVLKGKSHSTKGKTYEQILGSKEKALKRAKITSDWMKSHKNIRRYSTKISKPQLALFEKVKQEYPQAVLEYPIKWNNRTIWLDIAIVDLKINYEYDGLYWHQFNLDKERDIYLNSLGWKVIRISE